MTIRLRASNQRMMVTRANERGVSFCVQLSPLRTAATACGRRRCV